MAAPVPLTTNNHWSAPRCRLSSPPSSGRDPVSFAGLRVLVAEQHAKAESELKVFVLHRHSSRSGLVFRHVASKGPTAPRYDSLRLATATVYSLHDTKASRHIDCFHQITLAWLRRPGRNIQITTEITMALDSLHDLYVNELKDLYNAENQLLEGTSENGQGRLLAGTQGRI